MSGPRALLLDIGNTRLKWGVLDNGEIRRTGSIVRDTLPKTGFASLTTRLPRRVDRVVASNVAGQNFATRLSAAIGIHCNQQIHFVHSERAAFGLTNSYREPRKLGVDRWLAMIGAWTEFGGALCIVDAGTAMTIDAVDRSGVHLGGQIVPGIRLMGAALRHDTSDIPPPARSMKDPPPDIAMFANHTDGAVHNGALNAVCGAIERSIRVLRAAGQRPRIVLTGGDASRILTQLGGNLVHRPHLVLQGLAHIVQSEP